MSERTSADYYDLTRGGCITEELENEIASKLGERIRYRKDNGGNVLNTEENSSGLQLDKFGHELDLHTPFR